MKYSSYKLSVLFLPQIFVILLPVVFSFSPLRVSHGARARQIDPHHHPHAQTRQSRISGRAAHPEHPLLKSHLKVTDPSCKYRDRNIYEIDFNEEEIRQVSLFRKEYRLESYVGYPCKVSLYKEYVERFRTPALECPFRGNLDEQFQEFIWNELWDTDQTNLSYAHEPITNPNSSVLFQYICFSNQFEVCVPVNMSTPGTCDGICQCMDSVPVDNHHYPLLLHKSANQPYIKLENEIRCGVKAGGLCFPVWNPDCTPNGPNYNKSLETKYKKKDFYFKCESNAGCHTSKRICECAQGHECASSERPFSNVIWLLFCYLALIILFFYLVIYN